MKSTQKILILVVALLGSIFVITGCENSDKVDLFEAQVCLDRIDQTQSAAAIKAAAEVCSAKVSSQSNSQASLIRC